MKNLNRLIKHPGTENFNKYTHLVSLGKQLIEDTYCIYLSVFAMHLDNKTITRQAYQTNKKEFLRIKNNCLLKGDRLLDITSLLDYILECRKDLKTAMLYAERESKKDEQLYLAKMEKGKTSSSDNL
jgi:hypothetical protein